MSATSSSAHVGRPTLLSGSRNSTNAPASGTPGTRNARPRARRRCASARHARSGCRCAPRPGNLRAGSGTRRNPALAEPTPLLTATNRSSSDAGARCRQPTQVRTTGAFRTCVARPEAAVNARCVTGQSSVPGPARVVASSVDLLDLNSAAQPRGAAARAPAVAARSPDPAARGPGGAGASPGARPAPAGRVPHQNGYRSATR
jgi:hypothetical protein